MAIAFDHLRESSRLNLDTLATREFQESAIGRFGEPTCRILGMQLHIISNLLGEIWQFLLDPLSTKTRRPQE